jgi:hypothetical protein
MVCDGVKWLKNVSDGALERRRHVLQNWDTREISIKQRFIIQPHLFFNFRSFFLVLPFAKNFIMREMWKNT